MSVRFSAGLDLARSSDWACLLIAERKGGLLRQRRYEVRFANRWRGLAYQALIKEVASILSTPPFRDDVQLIVDATGVGAPVMEMIDAIKDDGLLRAEVTPVVFSSGNEPNPQKNSVPKRDLITRLEILLNEGQITFASDLLLAKTIRRELENFTAKLSETGRARFEAAGSGHDDWVSATALAVYDPPGFMFFSAKGGVIGGSEFHWEGDKIVYDDHGRWLPLTTEVAQLLPLDTRGQIQCRDCSLNVPLSPDVLASLRLGWFGHFDPYCFGTFEYQENSEMSLTTPAKTTTTTTRNPSGGKPVKVTRVVTPGTRDPNSAPARRDDRP